MNELKAAEAAYRRVISLNPGIAVVHNNLGAVLKDKGRSRRGAGCFRSCGQAAARITPRRTIIAARCCSSRRDWKRRWRLTAARSSFATITPTRSTMPALCFRSSAAPRRGDRSLSPATRRMPAHADARNNLGTALLAEGRPEEARQAFEQALVQRPDFPEAFYNLGNAWRELGNLTEAHRGLSQRLAASTRLRRRLQSARAIIARWLAHWDHHDADQEKLLDMVRQGVRVPPFYLFATPASAADQLAAARQWIAPIQPPPQARFDHLAARIPGRRRIRLGYLSADFHQHATAQLMAGLFERHDRDRFEVVAYCYGPDDGSPMRARLDSRLRPVRRRRQTCRTATPRSGSMQDKIDILIDLKGYTHRVPADDFGLPSGARAGQLSRLSRNHGRGFHRLHPGRPRLSFRKASRRSFREKLVSAAKHAIRSNDAGREMARRTLARRLRTAGREVWCFAASTTATSSRRHCSTSGCACCKVDSRQRACGCLRGQRAGQRAICARRRGARRRSRPAGFRAGAFRPPSISGVIGTPTCSSTRCPAMPTPPPAMRCGQDCRC